MPPGKPRVVIIGLIGFFATRHTNLLSINDDDVITRVDMRCGNRPCAYHASDLPLLYSIDPKFCLQHQPHTTFGLPLLFLH